VNRVYLRIFVGFFVANLLTLAITAFVSDRIARRSFALMEPDWPLVAQATVERLDSPEEASKRRWFNFMHARGIEFAVLSGTVSLTPWPVPPSILDRLEELMAEPSVVLHERGGASLVGVLVERPGAPPVRFVALRAPRQAPPRSAGPVLLQMLVSVLVIAAVGWWLARSVSRPVSAMQQAARRFAQGALDTRVGAPYTAGGDELAQLARDFDSMAARLQTSVQQMRGLLQDISHELRSPLARLQLAMELARDDIGARGAQQLDRAEREVSRLDRIIGETLALARLEGQIPGAEAEPVLLDALIAARLEEMRDRVESQRVQLVAAQLPSGLQVSGDRTLLSRALDNLLDNAIKFSPMGATVEVRLDHDDRHAQVCVLDRGPGVSERDLARLFEPFFRGDNASLADGQGLGLSIVRRIVESHEGRVSAQRREGGGLAMSMYLPLRRAA
jgi:signal transduction histidine kinase